MANPEMLHAWKQMTLRDLAPLAYQHGQITESQFDELEPDNPSWATQSKQEISLREAGTHLKRNERTLNQRRACHLTTENAIRARQEEARQADEYAKEQALAKDAKAKEKSSKKNAVEEEAEKKRAKAADDKRQKKAAETFNAQLTYATTKSMDCSHTWEEDEIEWKCSVCGLCDSCVQEHVTEKPDTWDLGWRACHKKRCNVVWCPTCMNYMGKIHEQRHWRAAHAPTTTNQIKKTKAAFDARATVQQQKAEAALAAQQPAHGNAAVVPHAPSDDAPWIAPREHPFAMK